MRIRFFTSLFLVGLSACWPPVQAQSFDLDEIQIGFEKQFQIEFTESVLKGITLGAEPANDRIDARETTLEFDLGYGLSEQTFFFFGGSFFDENESLETAGTTTSASGFERGEAGVKHRWGDTIRYQFEIGRLDYVDPRQWWWDEHLDSLRLQIDAGDLRLMIAGAREQARSRTSLNSIDPEVEDIERILLNMHWQFEDSAQFSLYFLDHDDESATFMLNDALIQDRSDAEDASLHWIGVEYRGGLAHSSLGNLDWMLGVAGVRGDERHYEFSAPVANVVTVDAIEDRKIKASAREISLTWVPKRLPRLRLLASHANGSGDANPGDSLVSSFRQTGLHSNGEDFHSYGELFQAELSNLDIDSLGVRYQANDFLDIHLIRHHYRQNEADAELRDVAIEADADGIHRDLGYETDLILNYRLADGLEVELIAAVFKAGDAYGAGAGRKSRFWSIDLSFEF